jgi:hypothetical protein
MTMPTVAAIAVVMLVATSSCARSSDRAPERRESAAARAGSAATRAGNSQYPIGTATSASPPAPVPPLTVTERGIGPLRVGMTFAEASAALGGALRVSAGADTARCDYLVWSGGPIGVQVMYDAHRVARLDVDTSSIATAAGARVGDDEARIKRLYPGRVTVTPHKYEDGHYLTVIPAASADRYRIIFETARGRVTRYRAGLMPSVEYVEGCA